MKEKFIYFRESFLQSVLADIVSFGFLILLLTLNEKFWGATTILRILFVIFFIIFALGKGSERRQEFYSKEDLKEFVNKL